MEIMHIPMGKIAQKEKEKRKKEKKVIQRKERKKKEREKLKSFLCPTFFSNCLHKIRIRFKSDRKMNFYFFLFFIFLESRTNEKSKIIF
jgi:hypothetical protein